MLALISMMFRIVNEEPTRISQAAVKADLRAAPQEMLTS